MQQLYLQSLEACGIDLRAHDIRFEEDNWESPTLGAWGIGWQVMFDGQEITQFTYFQQAGGIDLAPISVELTYGLERFAMALQDVDNVYDLEWGPGVTYRDVRHRDEVEQSKYAFGQVDMPKAEFNRIHRELFEQYYVLGQTLLRSELVLPALDYCLKCSHIFNLMDASGGIGVTERMSYILRVRQLAVAIAKKWAGIEDKHRESGEGAKMDRELLLEIGVEELPAAWLPGLTKQLSEKLQARLKEMRLTPDAPVESFGTPRRLTARIGRMPERQEDLDETVTGPPVSAAFNAAGEPTPAGARLREEAGRRRSRRSSASRPTRGSTSPRRNILRGKSTVDALPELLGVAAAGPRVPQADALGRDARGRQG